MRFVMTAALLLSALALDILRPNIPQAHAMAQVTDPEVVETVDLGRYAGQWYEIAHAPNWFQKDCVRSLAEYAVTSDSTISVHNTCFKKDGSVSDIQGVGTVPDRNVPAKIKVKFGPLQKGDYWIIDLDTNYQWAVVSAPKKKSLFILARKAVLDDTVLKTILENLKQKGFETEDLIFDEY